MGQQAAPVAPTLLKVIATGDKRAKDMAAQVFIHMREKAGPSVPDLVKLLETGDEDTRRSAAAALSNVGAEAMVAVPALSKLLGHDETLNQKAAAEARAAATVPGLEVEPPDPDRSLTPEERFNRALDQLTAPELGRLFPS